MRIPGSSSAVTALSAESVRLDVSASNVANVSTDGYRAMRVTNEATAGGGVRTRIDEPATPAGQLLTGDDGRDRVLSNVDLGAEVVTQISAQHAFEANLAVLRTGDEMLKALIDSKL